MSFSGNEKAFLTKVLETIREDFHADLDQLKLEIDQLSVAASQLQVGDEASLRALQQAIVNTRLTFKKSEYLLEYYDHDAIKTFLNGPPLPSLEKKVAEIRVYEPEGLQILDEMIFSEEAFDQKEEILVLSRQLQSTYANIYTYQKNISIQHRHVFEAGREAMIRVFTLGLTGFDTPGSVNGIEEAKVVFESLLPVYSAYQPMLEEKGATELSNDLVDRLTNGITYLKQNPDFNTFDRLHFLTEYINPLYDLIYQAQRKLGVELIYETNTQPQTINYDARNIFDPELLNPYLFANIHPKEATRERIELGRLLFFDPVLSSDNQRSCASCHHPDKAFTDGLAKSLSKSKVGTVERNAPTLVNAVFAEKYFHDLRLSMIEQQIHHVVFNKEEFDADFNLIVEKLKQSEEYTSLFEQAYSDYKNYNLSAWSVSNAITCYVMSLRSFNSPFDQYVRGERDRDRSFCSTWIQSFYGKSSLWDLPFCSAFQWNGASWLSGNGIGSLRCACYCRF